MNQLTILPEYIMSFMQRQNIKNKSTNKIYIEKSELSNKKVKPKNNKKKKNSKNKKQEEKKENSQNV